MHMNSAPHLLPEDRPEFERILKEALTTAQQWPDPAKAGRPLSTEQLRTMALAASSAIASCAATEYQHYVTVRGRLRRPAAAAEARTESGEGSDLPTVGPAAGAGESAQDSGAGLVAVLAVLVPVLAGTAAVIFLLIGYLLHAVSRDTRSADPLITAGWIFAALAAAAIVLAMAGVLITALRNSATSVRAGAVEERARELDQAREAWRQALLERGVLPFLREALAVPGPSSGRQDDDRPAARTTEGAYGGDPGLAARTPHLGYTRPGFSSPAADGGQEGDAVRPSYQSPGYTSPDFGGPEHEPS
jgi:hypothetical protein